MDAVSGNGQVPAPKICGRPAAVPELEVDAELDHDLALADYRARPDTDTRARWHAARDRLADLRRQRRTN